MRILPGSRVKVERCFSILRYTATSRAYARLASLRKSMNLNTALFIAQRNSALITWRTLCAVRMIMLTDWLYLGASRPSVSMPSFGFFMSFRGMTVLGLLGTPILLRYHRKLASRLHAQIVPLLNLQKLVPFSLIIFLTSGLMMTHGIS